VLNTVYPSGIALKNSVFYLFIYTEKPGVSIDNASFEKDAWFEYQKGQVRP